MAATASLDQITGSAGNDALTVTGAPAAGDMFDGGTGTDSISFTQGTMAIKNVETVSLQAGGAKTLALLSPSAGNIGVTLSADNDSILEADPGLTTVLNVSGTMGIGDRIMLDAQGSITAADKVKFMTPDVNQTAALQGVNIVIGNNGSDSFTLESSGPETQFIVGGGGLDSYTLLASSGSDSIVYRDTTDAPQAELISGFNATGGDRLVFARWNAGQNPNGFKGDTDNNGVLDANHLVFGNNPVRADADDYWAFNTSGVNKALSYDADGNGAGAEVLIAEFVNPVGLPDAASVATIIDFADGLAIVNNLINGNTPSL